MTSRREFIVGLTTKVRIQISFRPGFSTRFFHKATMITKKALWLTWQLKYMSFIAVDCVLDSPLENTTHHQNRNQKRIWRYDMWRKTKCPYRFNDEEVRRVIAVPDNNSVFPMRKKVKLIQTTLNTARTNSNLNVTAVFIQIYRRQTKSKALTPTDRVRSSQQNEPIRTRGNYRTWVPSAGKCAQVSRWLIDFRTRLVEFWPATWHTRDIAS